MKAITVVMATRNAAAFLAEALQSIALQRQCPLVGSLKLLVIDAGSTDGTQELVRGMAFATLQQQRGHGLWEAWNQAIEQVNTPWIAMLDSDDRWEPGALTAHLEAMAAQPEALVSIGRTRFVLDCPELPRGIRPALLQGSHRGPVPGATLFRREVFERLGVFDPSNSTASDVAWFVRLRHSGIAIAEPEAVVLTKRIHAHNLSNVLARGAHYDQDLLAIARASIQRQRLQQGRGTTL
jgi:glycosyltransferase involved in cell wall biosynthesis